MWSRIALFSLLMVYALDCVIKNPGVVAVIALGANILVFSHYVTEKIHEIRDGTTFSHALSRAEGEALFPEGIPHGDDLDCYPRIAVPNPRPTPTRNRRRKAGSRPCRGSQQSPCTP